MIDTYTPTIVMKSLHNGTVCFSSMNDQCDEAYIKFYTVNYKDGKMDDEEFGTYFFEQDIFGLFNLTGIEEAKVVIIDEIYVSEHFRSKGLAAMLLKHLINQNKNAIIFTQAVTLQKEYPECPSDDEINEIVAKATAFFIMNGFTSTNTYSQFETKEAMVYVNKASRPIIEYVCKLERKCKSVMYGEG